MFIVISFFRLIGAIFSVVLNAVGIGYYIKLKLRNRQARIRTTTLRALRRMLKNHDGEVRITIRNVKGKIFGMHVYDVTIPEHMAEWASARTHCIYAKEFLPDGEYRYTSRPDCIIFELINLDSSLGNFCVALQMPPEKPETEKESFWEKWLP